MPLVVGHQFVGVIAEMGRDVRGLQLVSSSPAKGTSFCGQCRNCRAGRRHLCVNTISIGATRDGAFAEYLALPSSNIWVADPAIPPRRAGDLRPLGNAAHTALSFDLVGEDVLITGRSRRLPGGGDRSPRRRPACRGLRLQPGSSRARQVMGASLTIDVRDQRAATRWRRSA